ncbi:MAG: F0F1 ATP synthase subunit delta [Chloroflexota bacterium]
MARKVYAKRYAQAVFQIALETRSLDSWQTDLEQVARLGDDVELLAFLEDPRLHLEDKVKLLARPLAGVKPLARQLLYLLLKQGRLGMIGGIYREYQRLLDSHQGIERAEVTTAVPLDEATRARLNERLGKILGKKVVLQPSVEPALVGGMVARAGGKLIDGSTSSRLAALKRDLSGTGR